MLFLRNQLRKPSAVSHRAHYLQWLCFGVVVLWGHAAFASGPVYQAQVEKIELAKKLIQKIPTQSELEKIRGDIMAEFIYLEHAIQRVPAKKYPAFRIGKLSHSINSALQELLVQKKSSSKKWTALKWKKAFYKKYGVKGHYAWMIAFHGEHDEALFQMGKEDGFIMKHTLWARHLIRSVFDEPQGPSQSLKEKVLYWLRYRSEMISIWRLSELDEKVRDELWALLKQKNLPHGVKEDRLIIANIVLLVAAKDPRFEQIPQKKLDSVAKYINLEYRKKQYKDERNGQMIIHGSRTFMLLKHMGVFPANVLVKQ